MSFIESNSAPGKQIVPLWIDGAAAPINASLLFPVVNAVSDTTVHWAQGADVAAAEAACDAASRAYAPWSRSSVNERRRVILAWADLIESHAAELAELQVCETSATTSYAGFTPKLAVGVLREIAGSISTAVRGFIPPVDGNDSYAFVMREPVGPALIIPPWNSPTILGPRGVASALAAGCTVVLKASELCPRLFLRLIELLEQTGLPKGCVNMVMAAREQAAEVTEALIAHRAIRKIEFIGSAVVGRIIGQLGAKYLKPVLMELGGKGPVIVLKDAGLKHAAKMAAFGAFVHHGQICMSTERILVVEEVAEEFTRLLQNEVATNYASGVGSAAAKHFAAKSRDMLQAAKKNGAAFLAGGGDGDFLDGSSTGIKPTIVTGVKREDALWDEESFCPSASLYVVKDIDEAVERANDSAYGLNAAVWTADTMTALDISRRLEYGQVHINAATTNDGPTMPVCGVKGSGWGDNNSIYGISEWLINKTVTIRRPDAPLTFGS